MNTNRKVEEKQSSGNLIGIASNNENYTPKHRLSTCSRSDLVLTSYFPRTGINTPKGYACVKPAKETARNTLSESNQSMNSRYAATQKDGSSELTATSMYLIDLITPLKLQRTPLKRTPLLKSALKNSVKGSAKDNAKNSTLSGSSGTNFQGRKIALETPVNKTSVSAPPKKSEQKQGAEGENKAMSTSARITKTTEKDFAKKLKINIERISENLPIISNIGDIKNRRSNLPAVSTVVGRPSSLSQSITEKLSKPTTKPQRILTTSTPFKLQKSTSKEVHSTPLKTANFTDGLRRKSCISSNQRTSKVTTKIPQRIILKTQETKTPKKDNKSVPFIEELNKSVNQMKENEDDALNATFTIDEEAGHNDGNKSGSKNKQSEVIELEPLEKIGDFAKFDCLKDVKEDIPPIVDEEIQGIDIPRQTNISETSKASDNKHRLGQVSDNEEIQSSENSSNLFKASLTMESPKKVQTPNITTRSFRKHFAEHTPVVTDLKGLKDILETPRTLNRTPVKELFKTPIVEGSGSKEGCGIKSLSKIPVITPKVLAAKQLLIIPKVTREENLDIKESVRIQCIVEGSQNNFVDIKEIKTLQDILSAQKNEFEPSLKRSAGETSTEEQTLGVLEDKESFTKLFHENYTELQSYDIQENSNISNTSVTVIQRPSIFSIDPPEKLETVEASVNAEIQSTLAPTGHDTIQRKLRRCTSYKITTATNLEILKKAACLKRVAEVRSSEITEIGNLVPSTPASRHEHVQRNVLEPKSSKMKTVTNLHTPKTICLKNADEVQRSETPESANIPRLESGKRKLRGSSYTKIKTLKNLQTPKKLIALKYDVEILKNADIPSSELQLKEIARKLDFPNTPVTTHETTQRKLRRSNTFDVGEVPEKIQTLAIGPVLEDSAEVQSCKNPEKSDVPSISVLGCEPIEKGLLRSSMGTTKIPTHPLDSISPYYGEAEENVDIPVEQSISKVETSKIQQMDLENNIEIQTDAVSEHSGTKGPLVAFKPVLGIIRKNTSSKMKPMKSLPTPETPLVLKDEIEVEKPEISENSNISTPNNQAKGNFQTSTIFEAEAPVNLQTLETSIVLEYDAEAQRVQNSENTNIPSTPIQDHNVLQRSSISKAEPQINLLGSEIPHAIKCDAETQIGEISEHADTTTTRVSTKISKINIQKRHSFMVIGQKISAIKRFKGRKKENRRHTTGPSIIKNHSKSTYDNNLTKTDLVASSKKQSDNLELERNAEDKDKSFSSLSEDIKSSDGPFKEKTPKAEPRKLFKSATFIVDSLKRPTISNSSLQRESTESGIVYTLAENMKHSKQLLKAPKEINQTPDLNKFPKLPKTARTSRLLEVKKLFHTPKPSNYIHFVGIKELMKTPKVARDSDDNYHSLNELLETPKDSLQQNDTSNKSFKYDESCELGDYETLLIENESYTPTSSQAEGERNLQVKHERVLGRKYRSYPTTPPVKPESSSTKPRISMISFRDTKEDENFAKSVSKSMRKFDLDEMEECEFFNTEMHSCPTTPIVGPKNNLSKTRKSADFYIGTEDDVCSSESMKTPIRECLQDELEEFESSDNTTDVTSREELLKTPNYINVAPKSQKGGKIFDVKEILNESKDPEKTTGFIGVKELLNTPKDGSSEDIRELGLKGLMKTPAKTPKPVRIKELFCTPKLEKEEELLGVKELMHEPKNLDQTVVMLGVKELLNTPKNDTSNEIRELGLKRLMKTPTQIPKPVRIKELFHSPKPEKEENLVGVKEVLLAPKNLDESTILVGIKELVKTSKKVKPPLPLSIKEKFNSSKNEKEACLGGIKELMKTGINELLEAPKSGANIEDFLGVPEMFSTPYHRLINKKDEDPMKTLRVEFLDQRINPISPSPKNLSPQKEMSNLAFKTLSAKMVMVLGTPQSVNINTGNLTSSTVPPPLYDLKENMEDVEEVFPTAIINEENDTLSIEESFDKFVGKPFIRKSYGRSRISMSNSSSATQFNKEKESERSKWLENASLVLSSEEVDENSRDVSDNAAVFSMSGIKTLERDEGLEEVEILENSQDEGVRNTVKKATDLIPIKIASPETSTLKKTGNKNAGKEIECKKDDPSEKKEENSQADLDVQNESIKYIDENLIIEEKEEKTGRKFENLVDNAQDLALRTPTQRERVRRKVEEPKAEEVKIKSLPTMSSEKGRESTPKTQPKRILEFKTPISAGLRARHVLCSNSTSVQASTRILQDQNQEEITVINNSVNKIKSKLPVATTTRTTGRRWLDSTKKKVEPLDAYVEKLETSLSRLPVAKSGRIRERPRTNSAKGDPVIEDVNLEQPETSRNIKGRKKADITKEETKVVGIEKREMSEIVTTAAISTRTRGRKRINSTKEVVHIVDEEKDYPETSAKIPSSVATSGRTRARRNVNSVKN